MQQRANRIRGDGQTIAFVPTMGYLHAGHVSLMEEARRRADRVVLSVFVNPTQFGPNEDLDSYPRDPERDMALAEKAGVDLFFTPDKDALYPAGYETYITQTQLPEHLCGLSRPGHFRGVMTIVAKLFNIVKPHYAVFGQKDYQQLAVLRRMTADLNFDIRIIGAPTVRETDGLAMSSRNKYLSERQRASALALSRALDAARILTEKGATESAALVASASATIEAVPETRIDYITICDPDTLEDVETIDRPVLMAMAVRVGNTRLIDNMMLTPPARQPGGTE